MPSRSHFSRAREASATGAYIDRSLDITDAYAGLSLGGVPGTWCVTPQDPWTSTVGTAVAAGATAVYLASGIPPGAVLAFVDASGGYETVGTYAGVYNTGGSVFVSLTTALAYAHAAGVTVKLAPTMDGTHPGPFLNQLVADGAVANAKLAGVFRF